MIDWERDGREILVAIGGLGGISALLGWLTGRRGRRATTTQAESSARKTDIEIDRLRDGAASDFERAVNERVQLVFQGYDAQIKSLTDEVHRLRSQIEHLLISLETTTRELHEAKARAEAQPFGA